MVKSSLFLVALSLCQVQSFVLQNQKAPRPPKLGQRKNAFHPPAATARVPFATGATKGTSLSKAATSLHASSVPTIPATLLSKTDTWGNWMVLMGNAALAIVMSKRTTVGKLLGPPITALALTFLMATIRILPSGGTLAAQGLQSLCLYLATPLVLMGAEFRGAGKRCGPLILSFGLAALATVGSSMVGWWLVGPTLNSALAGCGGVEDGLKIAAGIMARNVGGGLNYMAVCSSLQASPLAIAAGLCADNIFGLVYFPTSSYLASGRPDPADDPESALPGDKAYVDKKKDDGDANTVVAEATTMEPSTGEDETQTTSTEVEPTTKDDTQDITVDRVTTVLFTAAALVWLGKTLGGVRGALPVCTLLTVAFVNLLAPPKWVKSIQATSQVLGTVALYIFFSTLGSQGIAVADSVRASMIPLGIYLGILYSVHAAWLTLFHKLFPKQPAMNAQRLLIASSASIGGPATAVAMAQAQKWPSLEVPGLLVGNLGDAVGTFLGIAFFALFSTGG